MLYQILYQIVVLESWKNISSIFSAIYNLNNDRYNILLSLIYIVKNIFSVPFLSLDQGPVAMACQIQPTTFFINKVLLEHNHVHSFIVCSCVQATIAELCSCNRDCITYIGENIYYLALTEKVCWPLLYIVSKTINQTLINYIHLMFMYLFT